MTILDGQELDHPSGVELISNSKQIQIQITEVNQTKTNYSRMYTWVGTNYQISDLISILYASASIIAPATINCMLEKAINKY